MKTPQQIESARRGILGGEETYVADWKADTMKWERLGLYHKMAELADPRDGRFVVDIGTGLGTQLLYLAAQNERGLYIGTERTPRNVELAHSHLQSLGLDAVSALYTQELAVDFQNRLFWKQRCLPHLTTMRAQIRDVLQNQVLLVDDDIRRPQSLPAVLGHEKIDVALFSLPGGSASRVYEWPFHADLLNVDETRRRMLQVSHDTREGFYHFASKTVRDGGKMIVSERVSLHNDDDEVTAGLELLAERMGRFAKYWKTGRLATLVPSEVPQQVELLATHGGRLYRSDELQMLGQGVRLLIVELFRNTTIFSEAPLLVPQEA